MIRGDAQAGRDDVAGELPLEAPTPWDPGPLGVAELPPVPTDRNAVEPGTVRWLSTSIVWSTAVVLLPAMSVTVTTR